MALGLTQALAAMPCRLPGSMAPFLNQGLASTAEEVRVDSGKVEQAEARLKQLQVSEMLKSYVPFPLHANNR